MKTVHESAFSASFSAFLLASGYSQNNLENEELEHEWIHEGISETDSSASRWAWLDKWEIGTALKHAREVRTIQSVQQDRASSK